MVILKKCTPTRLIVFLLAATLVLGSLPVNAFSADDNIAYNAEFATYPNDSTDYGTEIATAPDDETDYNTKYDTTPDNDVDYNTDIDNPDCDKDYDVDYDTEADNPDYDEEFDLPYISNSIVAFNETDVTVTFLGNGGIVLDDQASRTTAEFTALGANFPTMTPTRYGFVFRHWNTVQILTDINPGTNFTSAAIVDSDIDVYAQWGRQVTFNVNAPELPAAQQTLPTIVIPDGFSTANMPVTPDTPVMNWPTPERPGFNFVEWRTDPLPGLGDLYTENSVINGSRSLYAHWEINPPYTVHFNPEGGTLANGHTAYRLTRPGMSIQASWLAPHLLNQGVLWPRSAPSVTRNNSNTPNGNLLTTSSSSTMTLSGWANTPLINSGQHFASSGTSSTTGNTNTSFAHETVTSAMVDAGGNMNVHARWVYRISFRTVRGGGVAQVATRDILVTPATLAGGAIADHGTVTGSFGTTNRGTITENRELPIPTRVGFTFIGWYNMRVPDNTEDTNLPIGARRLTVNCIINTCGIVYSRWVSDGDAIVTFELDGGEWTVQTDEIGERVVPHESTIFNRWGSVNSNVPANNNLPPMPRFPTKPGYAFAGWFIGPQPLPTAISTGDAAFRTNTGGGGRRFGGSSLVPAEGLTVYARWLPYHTVTFEANGGNLTGQLANHGNVRNIAQNWTFTNMNTVVGTSSGGHPISMNFYLLGQNNLTTTISGAVNRPNHTFEGWNTDYRGHGIAFLSSTQVTQNISVYVVWSPEITFNSNHSSFGGTDTTVVRNILYGRSLANHHLHPNTANAPLTMPSTANWPLLHVPNRAFVGWNMSSDGSGDWFDTTTVIPYDAATGAGSGAPFTVYAIWVEGVAFNPGAAPMDSILDVNRTREIVFPGALGNNMPPNPTWLGHNFMGWNTSPTGDLTSVGSETEIPGPWTLYAMWAAHVTFDAGNGDVTGQTVHTRNIGEAIGTTEFPSATHPTRVFLGWLCPYGQPFTSSTPIMNSKIVTAEWGIGIEVTFNANHGNEPATAIRPVTVDGTYADAVDHATVVALTDRTGFTFDGWWTTPESGGEQVTAETIVTSEQAHTLYARWTPIEPANHTVTFNLHGGTGNFPPQTVSDGGTANEPAAIPTRPNHIFDGWYTSAADGALFDFDTPITADTILHARWTPDVPVDNNQGGGGIGNDNRPGSDPGPVFPSGWAGRIAAAEEVTPPEILGYPPFIEEHIAYISGFPDGTVRPSQTITRAEVAMILFRLLDSNAKYSPQANHFSDVSAGNWYAQAINYLAGRNILAGYYDGTFRPNDSMTRAELAAVMSRFFELKESGMSSFYDVESNHWAFNYIMNAEGRDWITGYEDRTFRPNNAIIRAEAVTLINRVLNRNPNPATIRQHLAGITVFTDISQGHWAFYQIMEASISHEFERDSNGLEIWTYVLSIPNNN